jgi:DNA adenine methylase
MVEAEPRVLSVGGLRDSIHNVELAFADPARTRHPSALVVSLQALGPAPQSLLGSPSLAPFVKWAGGKSQELLGISRSAPPLTGRYIDPFVGGGSVLLAVPDRIEAWANDVVDDLVGLYRASAEQRTSFRTAVSGLATAWHDLATLECLYASLAKAFLEDSSALTAYSAGRGQSSLEGVLRAAGPGLEDEFCARLSKDLPGKFKRMQKIQTALGQALTERDLLANVEGAVRSAFYMAVRGRYNRARVSRRGDDERLADFFFLREFAYAAMFRFNSRGEFNVPYGGITYNRKSFAQKVDLLFSSTMLSRLQNTTWRSTDFEGFLLEAEPTDLDFVFVDPPYDSDFSSYDNRAFDGKDQERLQCVLEALSANVMIVIKDTPMIRRLYRSDRWRLIQSDKTYMWTIKSRNDRDVVHLTITNY